MSVAAMPTFRFQIMGDLSSLDADKKVKMMEHAYIHTY